MCRSSGLFGDFVGPARHRQMPAAALIKNCLLFGQIAEAAGRQPGNWTVKSRLFLLRRPSLPSCLARLYDLPNARLHKSFIYRSPEAITKKVRMFATILTPGIMWNWRKGQVGTN